MPSIFDQGALRARFLGQSFWRLRYTDGRVVNEWDCDWSLAPRTGRQAIRLHCPNGQVAELGGDSDRTDRLFQLKTAVMTAGLGRATEAHIVGLVDDLVGGCTFAAWLYEEGRLVTGRSNVHDFSFEGRPVGALAFEHLGLSPD